MENLLEVIQKALKKNTICNGKIPQITLNFNVSRTVREIMAPQLEYYFLNQHFLLLQVKESLSNHLSKRMKKMGGGLVGERFIDKGSLPLDVNEYRDSVDTIRIFSPRFQPRFLSALALFS